VQYGLATNEQIESVAEEIKALGRRAIEIKADVSKADQVKMFVEKTMTEFGKIDILVNNAGILGAVIPAVDLSEEEWDTVLNINLKSVFLCCKYVAPHMIRQRSGKIVNISSVSGKEGRSPPNSIHYNASKAGVISVTSSMAYELAEYNINVNCVCPHGLFTPMSEAFLKEQFGVTSSEQARKLYEAKMKQINLLKRNVLSEDIANAVVWLVSEESRNITAQAIPVDGGYLSIRPGYEKQPLESDPR
jgi:NAD(P)-dependent dehydrogenase (short-subunit alcohol dehydrogenase family)